MKKLQSLTDQLFLIIRSQQPGPLPQIESSKLSSGFWSVRCQQHVHTRQFCRNRQNRDRRMNGIPP